MVLAAKAMTRIRLGIVCRSYSGTDPGVSYAPDKLSGKSGG